MEHRRAGFGRYVSLELAMSRTGAMSAPRRAPWRDHAADMSAQWRAHRNGSDPQARTLLIDVYFPFARMLAAKIYAKRTYPELEFADYLQSASVGLIEAVDNFDPDRGVRFEPYAALRITGSVLDGVDSLSDLQQQVGVRKRAAQARVASLAEGAALPNEASTVFGTLAEIAVGLAIGMMLEDTGMFQKDPDAYPVVENFYDRAQMEQTRRYLLEHTRQLEGNEQRVITYHYLQQLSFDEIAKLLGLTNGRISQIHRAGLTRLRKFFESAGQVDLHY